VIPSDPRGIRRPPLTFDAPAHTPYRTALERTLKPSRLKRLGDVLDAHAQRELEKLVERGEGDICTEFASIFSAWVETEWLNLDTDIAPRLATNARSWVAAWRTQAWDDVKKYSDGFYDIARDLLNDRRENPKYDEALQLLLALDLVLTSGVGTQRKTLQLRCCRKGVRTETHWKNSISSDA
jgi:cytochrome P450